MHGVIALSEAVYREMADALSRPKCASMLTAGRRGEVLELLSTAAVWLTPSEQVQDCRDGKDNCYLELALAARAAAIVSGDMDLPVLDPWRGVRVLWPAHFVEVVRVWGR
jgi:putative PIN family toxin of toxin-antitoxin system